MVRIGHKSPSVSYNPASNDMSHFSPSSYVYNGYFYVSDEQYLKFLEFTDPTLLKPQEVLPEDLDWNALLGTDHAKRIERVMNLNPNRSLLWQFNALAPNMQDYIRNIVAFGERTFVVWSDFDVYVRWPLNKLKCWFLNKTLYFQNKKEIASWNKFLNEIHKKHA